MDYRDNRQRWAESHQVVHFYAGQWCTFTPALTVVHQKYVGEAKAPCNLPGVDAPGAVGQRNDAVFDGTGSGELGGPRATILRQACQDGGDRIRRRRVIGHMQGDRPSNLIAAGQGEAGMGAANVAQQNRIAAHRPRPQRRRRVRPPRPRCRTRARNAGHSGSGVGTFRPNGPAVPPAAWPGLGPAYRRRPRCRRG